MSILKPKDLILLFVFILFSGSYFANAQEGEIIRDIVFKTPDDSALHVHPEKLIRKLKLRRGDDFSSIVQDEDVKRLYATGWFNEIQSKVEKVEDGGVKIIYLLSERPVIKEVAFSGLKKMSSKKLREDITIAAGDYLNRAAIQENINIITDAYRNKSFLEAKITHKVIDVPDGVILTFIIDEGLRTSIKKLLFEGNKHFSDRKLKSVMQTKKDGLFNSGKFIQEKFDIDIFRLEAFYRNAGYLDVKVSSEMKKGTDEPRYWFSKVPIYISIKIEEGLRYKIDKIEIIGNSEIKTERLTALMQTHEGDYYSPLIINKDADKFIELYGEEGRIFTNVSTTPVILDKPGSLKLVIDIKESKPYKIRYIDVKGDTITRDVVIRRELRFQPGEIAKTERINFSKRKISELGLFKSVNITPIAVSEDEADMLVEIEESKTARLLFGVGAGGDNNVFGQVRFKQKNFDWRRPWSFKGDGQSLSIRALVGTKKSDFNVDFFEPYIFGKRWRFGIGAFRNDDERDEWDETRTGAYVTIGKELTEQMSFSFTLRPERIKLDEVDEDAPYVIWAEQGETDLVKFITRFNYDDTDSQFTPSNGYKIEFKGQYVGGFLGGDHDFYKLNAKISKFFRLFENEEGQPHIIQITLVGGYADEFNDSRVPVFERFFAGGIGTVRGFRNRTISPEIDDERIGGEAMYAANVEYTFPIFEDMLRGAVFFDAGRCWLPDNDFDSDGVRTSAGIGIHFKSPFLGPAPIRAYLAIPLNKEDNDDTQEFQFTFGINF